MLKYKLDSLDGLEDALKAFYVEREGVFYLDVDGGVEDVSGLKNKNSELLGKLQREKEQREQLEREKREADELRMREKGEFETLWKSERDKFEALREQYEAERAERMNQTREQFATQYAVELSGAVGEAQTRMMKEQLIKLVKSSDDGCYFELGGFKVEPEAVKQKMRDDLPFLCAGSQATGGQATGAKSKADSYGEKNPWKKDTFNLTEQARISKENPEMAERLKRSA